MERVRAGKELSGWANDTNAFGQRTRRRRCPLVKWADDVDAFITVICWRYGDEMQIWFNKMMWANCNPTCINQQKKYVHL